MIGEVLKQLDEEKFIVKVSSGPRYVVGVRKKVRKGGARIGGVSSSRGRSGDEISRRPASERTSILRQFSALSVLAYYLDP